ncbi:MAG: PAS domain-containing protein [Opitutales bacterium]
MHEKRINGASIKEIEDLRAALDEHAIVSITDSRGIITYANDKFCTISQYSREELLGQNHRISNSGHHSKEFMSHLWKTISNGKTWRGEFKNRTKDGSFYWVDATIMPILDGGGKPGQYVAIRTDITARKKAAEEIRLSKERYELAVRGSRAVIWDWDLTTDEIFCSDRLHEILGYTREEFPNDLSLFREAIHIEDRARARLAVEKHLNESVPYKLDLRLRTKSGDYRSFEVCGQALWGTEGKPFRMAGSMIDVTARKKAEQQSLRAQRLESVGTLASGIAHDLNNVLTPLMIAIGVLRTDEKDETRLKMLSIMESSLTRGADLIRQLLLYARGVEGDRVELCVQNLLRDTRKIADDTFLKTIQIQAQVPDGLWAVRGDSTQLHQVLLNLTVNARDAMPEGGTLKLSAENILLDEDSPILNGDGPPGPYVLIQVEDFGSGIPTTVIERIFDPFFSTKAVGQGTGLGLSTSLGIVQSHGGFIRVYSEEGKGSQFQVYLPGNPETLVDDEASPKAALPYGNGQLVLVVDDEPPVTNLVQTMLETFGYKTLIASSGTEAVALYKTHGHEVAVVLTDMMMPGIDGMALIHLLQEIDSHVRIIACSGVNVQDSRLTNAGIACFLAKPYTIEAVLNALKTTLSDSAPPAGECNTFSTVS